MNRPIKKRFKLEPCIYLVTNKEGKLLKKPFEVSIKRGFTKLKEAIKTYEKAKFLFNYAYIYETKTGFFVEVKLYKESYVEAWEAREAIRKDL
ncbi:hypothetical protein KLF50_14905 (plasmid) [Clostridium perfringens]|uniref:hypothetical protein n=1 Tax=Clostridium perfringens TaxID=1502 RepID=UPI001CC9868B|nr:hypothetical protein [Clostridium perfringens]UBK83453.1 hypothetical protein KLF50_14905 [Clostridium perfringens]